MKPDDYQTPQTFTRRMYDADVNGLLYPSVRHSGGLCIAAFRPTALAIPAQGMHLRYVYRRASHAITSVYEARML